MAVTLKERRVWTKRHEAIARNQRNQQLFYQGFGSTSDDDKDVLAAINGQTPGSLRQGTLLRNDADIQYLGGLSESIWDVVVNYVHPEHDNSEEEQDDYDQEQLSFDTSGGQVHIDVSYGTTGYPAAGVTLPDYKGAIRNGEGVDVLGPSLRVTMKKILPASVVTNQYIETLAALTGTVNKTTFKNWAAGEVLFAGAQGSQKNPRRSNQGKWDVNFNFELNGNETDLTVGEITGISKKGWQYLWAAFEETEDTNAKKVLRRPIAIYVEDVYLARHFSALLV